MNRGTIGNLMLIAAIVTIFSLTNQKMLRADFLGALVTPTETEEDESPTPTPTPTGSSTPTPDPTPTPTDTTTDTLNDSEDTANLRSGIYSAYFGAGSFAKSPVQVALTNVDPGAAIIQEADAKLARSGINPAAVLSAPIELSAIYNGKPANPVNPITFIANPSLQEGEVAQLLWLHPGTGQWTNVGSNAKIIDGLKAASGDPVISEDIIQTGIFRTAIGPIQSSGISDFINYPNPFSSDRGTNIRYVLAEKADVTLTIYDPTGNLVRKFKFFRGSAGGQAGVNTFYWDGTNGRGQKVASGAPYTFQLVAEGNQRHVKRRRGAVSR